MRPTTRLYAKVGRASEFLKPHAPTGLTGLYTHPAPRPHLIWLYSQTLEKLKSLPESSVYRQSTEAITKHRLAIIEAAVPKGFKEWQDRILKHIQEYPHAYDAGSLARKFQLNGVTYVLAEERIRMDERDLEWDEDEENVQAFESAIEGGKLSTEKAEKATETKTVEVENEPPLTATQVQDIEKDMGAGLLEEIVTVAQGELKLVDTMAKSKVWEELTEKPAEGQWRYFERN